MDDYLSKPINAEQMAQTLSKWLAGHEAEDSSGSRVAATTGDTEVAFDQAGLLDRLMGDRALAETIARQFLEDIPLQLCSLRKYLESGDATSVHRQAHTLKGAAAAVSAIGLCSIASETEQAARVGKLRDVAELLPRVEQQAERFKAALIRAGWTHPPLTI